MKAWVNWLREAWEKLRNAWYLALLFGWALLEALYALAEFVMHVLRIPHWH